METEKKVINYFADNTSLYSNCSFHVKSTGYLKDYNRYMYVIKEIYWQ